jgi:hypothetical protein
MHEPLGVPKNITLHWSAGTYTQTFSGYHLSIQGDGSVVVSCPLSVKGSHCWGRNTGNIGVSLCAMAKGCPVKPIQVERAARVCAELCFKYKLNPRGHVTLPKKKRVGANLVSVPGEITAPVIADHAWYARQDQYFPDRWDVGDFYGVIFHKACWYYDKLVAKAITPEYIK